MKEVLGIDCGGTVISGASSFWWPYANAFKVLRELKEKRFGDNIFVVSPCSFLRANYHLFLAMVPELLQKGRNKP